MLEYIQVNSEGLLGGIALFVIFALFHTLCAQNGFKEGLAKITSPFFVEHFWRIIYVLISLKLYFGIAVPYLYQHIPSTPLFSPSREVMHSLDIIGQIGRYSFILVLIEIDFLYYFGLKQAFHGTLVLLRIKSRDAEPVEYTLKTRFLYGLVRHPLYFSLIMMLAPTIVYVPGFISLMLILLYLAVGLPVEERKLIKQFGEDYVRYRAVTPSIIPFTKLAWFRRFKHV